MAAPANMVKGNAATLILACLAREPMHGYRIVRELKDLSEDYFVLGEGTLYPHLHQLEQDGLVEGAWETVSGGRERRVYRITDKGKAALAKQCAEWEKFRESMTKVLGPLPEGAGA